MPFGWNTYQHQAQKNLICLTAKHSIQNGRLEEKKHSKAWYILKCLPRVKNCLRVVLSIDLDSNIKHKVFVPWESRVAGWDSHTLFSRISQVGMHWFFTKVTLVSSLPNEYKEKINIIKGFQSTCKHYQSWKCFECLFMELCSYK